VVVKQCRKKEGYSERGDGSEDSDYEDGPGQAGHLVTDTEIEVGNNEESGQDTLPVLSVGSFAR